MKEEVKIIIKKLTAAAMTSLKSSSSFLGTAFFFLPLEPGGLPGPLEEDPEEDPEQDLSSKF